jgi:hypothetical protein
MQLHPISASLRNRPVLRLLLLDRAGDRDFKRMIPPFEEQKTDQFNTSLELLHHLVFHLQIGQVMLQRH